MRLTLPRRRALALVLAAALCAGVPPAAESRTIPAGPSGVARVRSRQLLPGWWPAAGIGSLRAVLGRPGLAFRQRRRPCGVSRRSRNLRAAACRLRCGRRARRTPRRCRPDGVRGDRRTGLPVPRRRAPGAVSRRSPASRRLRRPRGRPCAASSTIRPADFYEAVQDALRGAGRVRLTANAGSPIAANGPLR